MSSAATAEMQELPTPSQPLISTSAGFADWLAAHGVALALTTYQAGRLFFIGRKPDGDIRAHERLIENCKGLWTDGQSLWTSGAYMLWRFENALAPGEKAGSGADRKFVPVEGRVTGAVDCHDIAMGEVEGIPRPIFVNSLCNCLATISDTHSFRPLWKPSFISALVAEDRCHLNGLAMDGARPAWVTAAGRSDVADGWRDQRQSGGVVIDVASGEVAAAGLSMPHSPRLHEGRLWLLNSGTGEFGHVEPADGRFTPLCFCPGFARGLSFIGQYAVIGLSLPRHGGSFSGLALDRMLAGKSATPRAGLIIVNLRTGLAEQWLRFAHTITELYDVAVLPGTRAAEATGFRNDDIRREIRSEGLRDNPWVASRPTRTEDQR
ncbi:MAG TPA: TIGR03032 family protein [Paracoccus sp. (in: a-proteobacteria)]|uniref:TIGR03032 family protein n=1 Tax=Paracoccus sp. TaxID=267 RepID=UPI002C8F96BE|nr:TIGR03032 family protein [Paracoccus sp. (in: a-proteobacteria)]HWL55068.1 TIGR03032 family protein [Paracoccus sp. (in: a-proteobacteria)]